MKPTFNELRVCDIRQETEDTVSIAFEIPGELKADYAYDAGQYLTLRTEIDGEDVRRSYSICSGEHEDELRVAVKKVPGGKFSTFANEKLKTGDVLHVMTPIGGFTTKFDTSTAKSFLFFAAGSGITPVISLIKSILHSAPKSEVALVYGNKTLDSVIFREAIEDLKNTYMNRFSVLHVFSREKIGNRLQDGRLDKDRILNIHHAFFEHGTVDEIFVCGPEPIIYAVKDAYGELDYDENKVRFELFTTPGESNEKRKVEHREQGPRIDANVKIILDGEETLLDLDSDGDNILEAAQKAGADVPFSCKGGVCCTCRAKILKGTAKMDVNYALEDDEVADGYILTCQSHPTSDELIVSYDD